jgi:hypothetical protein
VAVGGPQGSPPPARPAPAAATPTCSLELSTEPPGAELYRAGKLLGTTPYSGELDCDSAPLEIRKEGFATVEKEVAFDPKAPARVSLTLKRPVHELKIASEPSGASVWVNGEARGKTPIRVEVPGFQDAEVKVEKDGYLPFESTVEATEPLVEVSAGLEQRTASAKKADRKRKRRARRRRRAKRRTRQPVDSETDEKPSEAKAGASSWIEL